MIKILKNLSARIVLSLLVAFFFASTTTHIMYPCDTYSIYANCVSFEKSVMHPRDMLANVDNSLTIFTKKFVIISLVGFMSLSLYASRKKTNDSKEKK